MELTPKNALNARKKAVEDGSFEKYMKSYIENKEDEPFDCYEPDRNDCERAAEGIVLYSQIENIPVMFWRESNEWLAEITMTKGYERFTHMTQGFDGTLEYCIYMVKDLIAGLKEYY